MSSFEKVIGYRSIKRELLQICDMIRNRAIYEEMGARLPHGLLLYGDPGLGKSLLAKCFIEESGLNTVTVRRDKGGDAFIDSIKQAFTRAKEEAPAIVFLDDMDKFANEDCSHSDAPEYVAVQAGIDDVKETDVFVIATANEICRLPDSLRRSGRFDRKIGLQAPTAVDAEAIIAHYLSGQQVSDDINMKDLTKMMSYHSCAELETILNEAAIRAAFSRKDSIGMEDMVGTVLKQQYGASEDIPHNSEETVKKTALHEAGHLVVCEIVCAGSVGFASLVPSREDRWGGFVHTCTTIPDSCAALVALASKAAAEMRYAGQAAEGCSRDLQRAINCIREAAAKEGTLGLSLLDVESNSSNPMSESLNARSEAAVQVELERCYNRAKSILSENELFLEKITEAFIEKKTLLCSDIQRIRSATAKDSPERAHETVSQYHNKDEDLDEARKDRIRRVLEEHRRNRCY